MIREAAVAVLAGSGWGRFTIEAVAAEAGVARSTIYRHWPDKLSLLVDALEHHSTQPPAADCAPGRPRVVALVRHLAEAMADRDRSPIVPALIDAAERDPALRRLHRKFTERRRKALTTALSDAGVDNPELVAIALSGAVIYCRVMTGRPLDPDRTEELVTSILGPTD
ncbi:MAG TPA: TetR-like C-terminal domain-containing protein [Acidimicrobiia bacterium]|nr:TetR-like C-terminal domain-containing protein [Acidimicrobiia bacterium]